MQTDLHVGEEKNGHRGEAEEDERPVYVRPAERARHG